MSVLQASVVINAQMESSHIRPGQQASGPELLTGSQSSSSILQTSEVVGVGVGGVVVVVASV